MFPTEILLACLVAVLIVVVAPGPDNILAISRGLSRGRAAAALIPQFTSPLRGPVFLQMIGYGLIFAAVTAVILTVLGSFAAQLSGWLSRRAHAVAVVKVGAGFTFVAAGLSFLTLGRRR